MNYRFLYFCKNTDRHASPLGYGNFVHCTYAFAIMYALVDCNNFFVSCC